MSDKHILLGKTLERIEITEDRKAIRFISEGQALVARCDADCCSYTWVEDFLNPNALIGSPITEVNNLDLPENLQGPTKTENYEEKMHYYGIQIKTAKGTATIAYRNSSNGYYGGSLIFPDEHFWGGVYEQNIADETDWQVLAESFSQTPSSNPKEEG